MGVYSRVSVNPVYVRAGTVDYSGKAIFFNFFLSGVDVGGGMHCCTLAS